MDMNAYMLQVDAAYENLSGPVLEARLLELLSQSLEEFGGESSFYASMLSELGGFYRGQGQFEKSEDFFKKALAILCSKLGETHPDSVTALNNLAGTHRLMGKLEDAEREFRRCVELYGAALGKGHILYAAALNNLSLLCMDKKDLDGAAEYMAAASQVLAALPENQDEYATSLANLGSLYLYKGSYAQAKDVLERSVELYENCLGTRTPHYHAALNSLGMALMKLGDIEQACTSLEKAAAAAGSLYGREHREYKSIVSLLERLTGQEAQP